MRRFGAMVRKVDWFLKLKWPNRIMNVGIIVAMVINIWVGMLFICQLPSITFDPRSKNGLTGLDQRIVDREIEREEKQRRRLMK